MKRIALIISCLVLMSLTNKISAEDQIYQALMNDITYVVDQSGNGNYTKITDAINAVPNNSSNRTVIYVKNGSYYEKIHVSTSKKNLVLIGQNVDSTIITYDDYSGKTAELNTFNSETFRVDADDFWAINISLRNDSYDDPNGSVTQAPALITDGDRQVFLHCKLWGFQDTYYSRSSANRAYFKDCYIAGTVDFIFGESVVVFDSCQIHNLRKSGGYITAASTEQGSKFGYVFMNSRLTSPIGVGGFYFGRPWKNYSKTVFLNTYEGSCITGAGWKAWNVASENTFYAEYKCYGPGSDITKRVDWSHQLSDAQAAEYTIENIYAAKNSSHLSSDWLPSVESDTLYQVISPFIEKYLSEINLSSKLSSLKYNNIEISDFDKDKFLYVVEFPKGTTEIPVVSLEPENPKTKIDIVYPEQIPGFVEVNISTLNETSNSTYEVYFSVDSSYHSADLLGISIKDVPVEGFDPDITEYTVSVPEGTSKFMPFDYVTKDEDAKVRKSNPSYLPGQYVITVTAIDGVTKKQYYVNIDFASGIHSNKENVLNVEVNNPFSDYLKLELNKPYGGNMEVVLINMVGQVVKQKKQSYFSQGQKEIILDTKDLLKGVYFYKLHVNENTLTGRLVKY